MSLEKKNAAVGHITCIKSTSDLSSKWFSDSDSDKTTYDENIFCSTESLEILDILPSKENTPVLPAKQIHGKKMSPQTREIRRRVSTLLQRDSQIKVMPKKKVHPKKSSDLVSILRHISPLDFYNLALAKLCAKDPNAVESISSLLPVDALETVINNFSPPSSPETIADSGGFFSYSDESKSDEEQQQNTNWETMLSHKSMTFHTHQNFIDKKVFRSISSQGVQKLTHCLRCHTDFDIKSESKKICPKSFHPKSMVLKNENFTDGASFKCLACRVNFMLIDEFEYVEGKNLESTGFCQELFCVGDRDSLSAGAVKCQEKGCFEFYV